MLRIADLTGKVAMNVSALLGKINLHSVREEKCKGENESCNATGAAVAPCPAGSTSRKAERVFPVGACTNTCM